MNSIMYEDLETIDDDILAKPLTTVKELTDFCSELDDVAFKAKVVIIHPFSSVTGYRRL